MASETDGRQYRQPTIDNTVPGEVSSLTRQETSSDNRNRMSEEELVAAAELSPTPEDDDRRSSAATVTAVHANPDDFSSIRVSMIPDNCN